MKRRQARRSGPPWKALGLSPIVGPGNTSAPFLGFGSPCSWFGGTVFQEQDHQHRCFTRPITSLRPRRPAFASVALITAASASPGHLTPLGRGGGRRGGFKGLERKRLNVGPPLEEFERTRVHDGSWMFVGQAFEGSPPDPPPPSGASGMGA